MSAVKTLLEESRKKLLDLTLRNTLLNYNLKRKSRLVIVDELPDVLYAQLLEGGVMRLDGVPFPKHVEDDGFQAFLETLAFSAEGKGCGLLDYAYFHNVICVGFEKLANIDKSTGFVNVRTQAKKLGILVEEEAPQVLQPIAHKHTDNAIQTLHYPDTLEKMMQKRKREAKTAIEETGSNLLYLAIGFLKWKASVSSDRELYAPLILLPVEIRRGKADKHTGVYTYDICYTDDEMFSNISLIYKIQKEFGIEIPTFTEELSPETYFAEIEKVCVSRPELIGVSRRFALDFFHFSKLLMYLDLESSNWSNARPLETNPLLAEIAGEHSIEEKNTPSTDPSNTEQMGLVLDADSSQRDAIAQVMQGDNLIIEGPPGTGKSQTIANLIAVALSKGKKVLFVAEKLVALEVVKKRLDVMGLGDFILELHSHKSNKASVYGALRQRVELELSTTTQMLDASITEVEGLKEGLQAYLNVLNKAFPIVEQSPFRVFGEVQNRVKEAYESLPMMESFLTIDAKILTKIERQLLALETCLAEDAAALDSVWRGFIATHAIGFDADNIVALFATLREQYASLQTLFYTYEVEGLTPTEESLVMLSSLDKQGLLASCPSVEALRSVSSLDEDLYGRLLEQSEALLAKVKLLETLDLEGVEERSRLTSLSRTLRGHKDIGIWGKWFNKEYKEARKDFNRIVLQEIANDPYEMCRVLDHYNALLESYFKEQKVFYDEGAEVLGLGEASEKLGDIEKQVEVLQGLEDFRETVDWKVQLDAAGFPETLLPLLLQDNQAQHIQSLQNLVYGYADIQANLTDTLGKIGHYGVLDEEVFFEGASSTEARGKVLDTKLKQSDTLATWIDISRLLGGVHEAKLEPLLDYAKEHGLEQSLRALFLYGYYREWSYKMLRDEYILAKFSRHTSEANLSAYRKLDKSLGGLHAKEHALVLAKQVAPEGRAGKVADKTEMQLIRNEIHKQKRHIPIRQLLKRAPNALRALKPCFMMSPLSVAQFVSPEDEPFDLIVMDEASQILPEDALGAIARAKQVVVVGDPNQLPPTSFFMASTQEDDESEETTATTAESILDLMLRVYPSAKRLKWHYRSQHESLIAFSNHHFYDDELMIFPSAVAQSDDVGISRVYIENGYYQQQQNMTEANVIVQAIVSQMAKGSNETLGVVAMNKKQASTIDELLENACREDIELSTQVEKAFKEGRLFIKNLENVQGDEADILFIGTTYGPDVESKKVYQRFGPINGEHGWRRMNVLVTRAKKKIVLFTSMLSSDIVASEGNRGRMALKNYLAYAEKGKLTSQATLSKSKEHDEPLEASILRYVESLGYVVNTKVGVSGFFIDIGVRAEGSDNYILGIECDGVAYNANKSVRDRDRIRPEVLENMGWEIYRVWSVDWFKNTKSEKERLKKCLFELKSRYI